MKIRVILWLLIAAAAGGLLAGCGKAEKTAVDIQRVVKIVGQQPREMEFIRKIRVQNIELDLPSTSARPYQRQL